MVERFLSYNVVLDLRGDNGLCIFTGLYLFTSNLYLLVHAHSERDPPYPTPLVFCTCLNVTFHGARFSVTLYTDGDRGTTPNPEWLHSSTLSHKILRISLGGPSPLSGHARNPYYL